MIKSVKLNFVKNMFHSQIPHLKAYLSWIHRLCRFSGKDRSVMITTEDISEFRQSLTCMSPRSQAVACAAINTVYTKILWPRMPEEFKKDFASVMNHRPKQPHSLPDTAILSKDIIQKWLDNISNPMYHLGCSMLYFQGLRLSEVCMLSAAAVRHEQLQAGNRILPVAQNLQKLLNHQKRHAKKLMSSWLFPSPHNPRRHISASVLQKALHTARPENVDVGSGVRTLRASFIIHRLQVGKTCYAKGWYPEKGKSTHLPAQLCHPSAGIRL